MRALATLASALTTLKMLTDELDRRRKPADELSDYYRGKHRLQFASQKFADYFKGRYAGFRDNWCAPVAEAPTERLVLQGIRVPTSDGEGEADSDLWRVYAENGLEADSGLAFLDSINTSRSFGLVWGNPDDETTPEMTFESCTQAIVGYVPGSRRRRQSALKLWADEQTEYATLYLPDELWKFQRRKTYREGAGIVLPANIELGMNGWSPRQPASDDVWPLPNPMGEVPMVELPNRPLLGEEPLSDISGVKAMQDAINLFWAHLLTASDYAALPQRVVLGADTPRVPILDKNGQEIGTRPMDLRTLAENRILFVPDDKAKMAEWSAANLNAFTEVIGVAVQHVAAQTRTPQHYLEGKMANLAAEALKAAETGLVKKTEEKQLYFGEGLREMFRLAALAQDDDAKAARIRHATMLWKDAEMRSEAQLVDGILKLRSIGFPFQWCAERYGLSPVEVARIMQMRDDEQNQALMAGFLSGAQETPPGAPNPQQLPAAPTS